MSIWVYMAGNVMTAATIILSAAFAAGKLSQVLAALQEQMIQIRTDLKEHEARDLDAFDAVNRSLLEIAMRLGDHPDHR